MEGQPEHNGHDESSQLYIILFPSLIHTTEVDNFVSLFLQ